ncbi:MAG: response regulator [Chloroherpetonaceae bacterium]|nr:response regulator [Chloroherpetonaceae bacterium]MDW8438136.1 response regulator [Chloroherpetonaceae bacterium]
MNRKLKLLLVDDEPEMLESLTQLFDYDYKVLTATSGEAALSLLNSHRDTAIVISDQRMSGMRGVDLLRHVKQIIPDSMRILLTGYSDLESVLESVNVGEVFRYVRKPWQPDTLKSIVALAAATYMLRGQREKKAAPASSKAPSLVEALKALPPKPEPQLPAPLSAEPPKRAEELQPQKPLPVEPSALAQTPTSEIAETEFLADLEKTLDALPVQPIQEEEIKPIENLQAEFQAYFTDDIVEELKRYASFEEEFFARLNEANDLDLIATDDLTSFEKRFCGKSGNPRVLFVDDDSDVLYLLSETFKKEYDVFTCLSAESAMELLEGKSFFACIVADLRMPGQSGADFLIQAEAIEPLVPKILMSSYADAEVIVSLVNHGLLYRFVSKPYDVPNLKNIIKSAVEECRRRVESGLQFRNVKRAILHPTAAQPVREEIYFPSKPNSAS